VYILRVERNARRLQNTVIHTYPMVSQFWTYKLEDFLRSRPTRGIIPPETLRSLSRARSDRPAREVSDPAAFPAYPRSSKKSREPVNPLSDLVLA